MAHKGDSSEFHMKKRKLTRFLCQEMLYDYVSNQLDPERAEAVEEFLKTSPECQKELESLKAGLLYVEQISQTEISEPLYKKIRDAKSPFSQWVGRYHWRNWPEAARWTLEAVAVSAVVVLVAAVVAPKVVEWWPEANEQKVLLAEVEKQNREIEPSDDHTHAHGEEEVELAEPATPAESQSAASPVAESEPEESPPKPEPQAAASPSPEKASSQEDEDISEPQTQPKASSKAMRGFLYRAFMELDNLEILTDRIAEDITKLGGEKAGQVPLGWKKPKGSYYHFTLPETNYDQLVNVLKNYGAVRVYKDPHPRVMPEGVIRLILWIEDASLKQE